MKQWIKPAAAAMQSHWMRRRRRKEIVVTHTVTVVRGENKFAQMPALYGSAHALIRMTALTLSANQEVRPELQQLLQFARCCLFSSMQFRENNALLTLKHESFYRKKTPVIPELGWVRQYTWPSNSYKKSSDGQSPDSTYYIPGRAPGIFYKTEMFGSSG